RCALPPDLFGGRWHRPLHPDASRAAPGAPRRGRRDDRLSLGQTSATGSSTTDPDADRLAEAPGARHHLLGSDRLASPASPRRDRSVSLTLLRRSGAPAEGDGARGDSPRSDPAPLPGRGEPDSALRLPAAL